MKSRPGLQGEYGPVLVHDYRDGFLEHRRWNWNVGRPRGDVKVAGEKRWIVSREMLKCTGDHRSEYFVIFT